VGKHLIPTSDSLRKAIGLPVAPEINFCGVLCYCSEQSN